MKKKLETNKAAARLALAQQPLPFNDPSITLRLAVLIEEKLANIIELRRMVENLYQSLGQLRRIVNDDLRMELEGNKFVDHTLMVLKKLYYKPKKKI